MKFGLGDMREPVSGWLGTARHWARRRLGRLSGLKINPAFEAEDRHLCSLVDSVRAWVLLSGAECCDLG